jgi:hypothetical protein
MGRGGSAVLIQKRLASSFVRYARGVLRVAATATILGPAASCYDSTSLRLAVHSPPTTLDCARTIDSVFFDSAYVRINNVTGPDLFYTPRLPPVPMAGLVGPRASAWAMTPSDLGWGIGVWLKNGAKDDPPTGGHSVCGFELEALTPEPGPGMSRRYVGQRGETFDRTVREMAQRLTAAFDGARSPG